MRSPAIPPKFDPPPSWEYAHAIVETVRAPLLVLDEDLQIVSANPAFLRTYGLEGDEVVGHHVFEVGDGEWDVPELRSALDRLLPEKRAIKDLTLRIPLGSLGLRDIELDARQISLGGVDKDLILLSLEDVTERERSRRRQVRHTAELERSNRDLQDFAHAASHDLQEPLRKISVYVDQLASSLDLESLDERGRRAMERLPQATRRLQERIDDLLQLARVGRATPQVQKTDLGEVVASALGDLEVAIRESGAQVDVAALPVVMADTAQMAVLFQNLIGNALKFRTEGAPPVVRVRANDEQESHVIVVEDEGIGFEQEHAERIFGAFQRLHGREAYTGSGVGLAICRRIAEHHGGEISAEGRPGQGARFIVRLPKTPPTMQAIP